MDRTRRATRAGTEPIELSPSGAACMGKRGTSGQAGPSRGRSPDSDRRVLMLGWDFPPAISGGIGTACLGLTRALSAAGAQITFVLPRCPDETLPAHEVVGLGQTPPPAPPPAPGPVAEPAAAPNTGNPPAPKMRYVDGGLSAVDFVEIDAVLWPYRRPDGSNGTDGGDGATCSGPNGQERQSATGTTAPAACFPTPPTASPQPATPPPPGIAPDDLFREIDRYGELARKASAERAFDVVHAHDWMTFPAARAIAAASGKPMIAHVHSTEFDRSGGHIDQRIYDIERAGIEAADRVIAVSYMTRRILTSRYAAPIDKIAVIYNAVNLDDASRPRPPTPAAIGKDEKVVLFLGRITVQKGPEYFLAAARKVLEVYHNVRFVMAGSGDAIAQTMRLARDMGLGDKVVFTGFLNGRDVERVFRSADLYVMPSVSDPFGIASLEAISYDVPVLMSRQSGAAEVLHHVLKVDFWEIEEMANKIVAVLRHPPLRAMLQTQAGYDLRRMSWAQTARQCLTLYNDAMDSAKRRRALAVRA
jgi:glycogen(starch) synthase